MIPIFRNILATIGGVFVVLIIVLIAWWKFSFSASSASDSNSIFTPEITVNPTRTHVAHHELTDKDEILYQREEYVALLGDGGGYVATKLNEPLEYSTEAWFPLSQMPKEYLSFISPNNEGSEDLNRAINAPKAIWCVLNLTRSGEHISNIVLAVYDPDSRILFEYISRT